MLRKRTPYRILPLSLISLIGVVALAACTPGEELPPPRPTVIVITASGPYFTTFDDPSDWLSGETETSRGQVEGGRYHLAVTAPHHLAWTNQTRAFGEGFYEVETTLLSGPEASAFGILLLGSNDMGSFFYCMITGDGRYDIGYCENGCKTQKSLIGDFALTPVILTGRQTNRLRVELADGQLTFIVNGAQVGQVQGLTYTTGLVGLISESSQYGGFEVAFDNLYVVERTPE